MDPDGTPNEESVACLLIVDDEPDFLFTMSYLLQGKGFQTLTAETGEQALQVVRENDVDIALLDIRLPDMTGTHLLQAIKEISPDIDCIMSTGDPSFETVLDALNAGASAYFEKPVKLLPLTSTLRDLAEKQRFRKENLKLLASLEEADRIQRRTIQHLQLLQELSRTISSTLNMDEVLLMVRNAIIGAMGYNRCAIYLVDLELEQIQGRWGTDRDGNLQDLTSFVIPLSTNRPMAKVARREIPFFLTQDMDEFLHYDGPGLREEMEGIRAHAVLPLEAKGKIVGVLTVDNLLNGKPITQEDIDQLLPFTYQAAIAIDNARLYTKSQELAQRETEKLADLEMLWQVAQALSYVLELDRVFETVESGVCSAMQVNHFSLFLYNKTYNEYELRAGCGVDQDLAHDALFSGDHPIGDEVVNGGRQIFDQIQEDPNSPLGRLAVEADIHSMMCVPLRVGEEPIGLMAVYSVRESRFSSRDDRLLSTLASMASSAIRTALSYFKERQIAVTFQEELLSETPDRIGDYDIQTQYKSALDEARVGGDFYDVIELPDGRAAILLADVSGKGLKAAVYTAMGKYMFRGLLMDNPSPGVLLGKLNSALYRYTEAGMFITLFYGLLDPKTGIISYANGGHESPLHYMAEHDFSITLDTTGIVLGVDPDAVYVERQVQLKSGDLLLLYTDGLTDARKGDEMLGIEGLHPLLKETLEEKPESIVDRIYEKAFAYADGFLHDDIAMIAVKADVKVNDDDDVDANDANPSGDSV